MSNCQHSEFNVGNKQKQSGQDQQQANIEEGEIHHQDLPTDLTHKLNSLTPYYTTGPQQARPADGNLPLGTRVKLIKNEGSYSLVTTENGISAYVLTSALH